ncbi:MAG: MHYT domain-containing protein [Hyphomicrobiales bacterium]
MSHNYWLVVASLAIALMAGFTGLSILHGASTMSIDRRKRAVCYAAVTLGGGIWSMHFVAMLGLQLPIMFYYDTLTTLFSALIAILVVGVALLILHFRVRTTATKIISGSIIGLGILAMHYTGMSGMERCLPVYDFFGLLIAFVASITLSIGAIWVAYSERNRKNIIYGTLFFGFAVFAVHFVAMAGTRFIVIEAIETAERFISNDTLAYIVTLGSFIICGAFLLNSATFSPAVTAHSRGHQPAVIPSLENEGSDEALDNATPVADTTVKRSAQVPFEKNGKTFFIAYSDIAAIRAEGHYTIVYSKDEKLFCPWSLSEAEKRLPDTSFIKTHRSYLVNPDHVSGFERKKDNGICFFQTIASLEKVPVSRTRLPVIRKALGLI